MKHYYTVEIENKRSGSLPSRIARNVEQRLAEKKRREEQEGT